MLDLCIRPVNLCKVYRGPFYQSLDLDCLSVSRLTDLLQYFPLMIEQSDADFKSSITQFSRVSIDAKIDDRILNILKGHFQKDKFFELEISDPQCETLMNITSNSTFARCYLWNREYFKAKYSSESTILDFGKLVHDVMLMEVEVSPQFALQMFFSCLNYFDQINLNDFLDSKYFKALTKSYKPFDSILISPNNETSCISGKALSQFLNVHRNIQRLAIPCGYVPRQLDIRTIFFERISYLDMSGCEDLGLHDYSVFLPRLRHAESLTLPRFVEGEVFNMIERFCLKVTEIGLTAPFALKNEFAAFLSRFSYKLQSLMIFHDESVDLRKFPPSYLVQKVRIIESKLSRFSTVFQLGAIYPNLKELDIRGSSIRELELTCFHLIFKSIFLRHSFENEQTEPHIEVVEII